MRPHSVEAVRARLRSAAQSVTQIALPAELRSELPEDTAAATLYSFDAPVELISEAPGMFYAVQDGRMMRYFPGARAKRILHVVRPEDGATTEEIKAEAQGVVQNGVVEWSLELA